MEGESPYEEFTGRENNILYALVKRRAVGDKRPQMLDELLRVQRVDEDEREEFVSSIQRKCESRAWLTFYNRGDDQVYVYINPEAWGTIRTYLDLVEP